MTRIGHFSDRGPIVKPIMKGWFLFWVAGLNLTGL